MLSLYHNSTIFYMLRCTFVLVEYSKYLIVHLHFLIVAQMHHQYDTESQNQCCSHRIQACRHFNVTQKHILLKYEEVCPVRK